MIHTYIKAFKELQNDILGIVVFAFTDGGASKIEEVQNDGENTAGVGEL